MKLSEHVEQIRSLIYKAFNNQFARLGVGANKLMELNNLPEELRIKRTKIEVLIKSHKNEKGNYEEAREKALDELTFTLFNRLAAIKVMESLQLFPPIITKESEHGDRSFGHKVWLEQNPDMRDEELEGIRKYLDYEFSKLGESIPLYSPNYPYALLPFTIELNEIIDTFNFVDIDKQVEDNIWQSDDILGWLYESYNNVKKQAHKDSKAKTEYHKVSIQSQVYTPRWVVEFLVHNSLGKMYLEMYPDSEIKDNYKIANAPQKRVREIKPLREIKLIDPASGSGNFLLYAFSFFYDLYTDQIDNYGADYDEDDIPQLIIENNLHGIDLDDRAIQLAQLGLWIKAKQKQRNIGSLKFNVVSSDFTLPDFDFALSIFRQDIKDAKQMETAELIWKDLQDAHKFGSLVKLNEKIDAHISALIDTSTPLFSKQEALLNQQFKTTFLANLQQAFIRFANQQGNSFLTDKTKDAITFLKLITQKYDVATANPPYTDSADFGPDLKKFIETNYKKPYKFNTNLYATFIKRCFELTKSNGMVAMIHPLTFMFIKTFEDVRKFLLMEGVINIFVHHGPDATNIFDGSFASAPAYYIIEKKKRINDKSLFISVDKYTRTTQEKYKKDIVISALEDYINNEDNVHNFSILQSELKLIKSWPFVYWISDKIREKFSNDLLEDVFCPKAGLQTANNNRFLRYWWEVCENKRDYLIQSKWVTYSKGGPFNRWYGNLWLTVNWEGSGDEIKNFTDDKGKVRSRPQNESYYLKEGITFSTLGSKVSFRELPEGNMFDMGGSSLFAISEYKNVMYCLGYVNSKMAGYLSYCLNPTVNTQIGDIQRIPFVYSTSNIEDVITSLSVSNVEIKKWLTKYSIFELNWEESKLMIESNIKGFLEIENHLLSQVYINEAIINEKVFEVFELTKNDKEMVLAKEGVSIGVLPVSKVAKEAYLANEVTDFSLDNIRDYIQNLPEQEFETTIREAIENEFPQLYQSNNDLEEFCIRHQVNPINVWYWFKESNVIPKQRMNDLAMEFLADMLREILIEDEDGIIPLVPNAGEKILLDRIEEKFIEKGFSMAQYSSFDSVLGRELNEYINNHFFKNFSDHLNLFMYLPKTPFIWHLTSGPEQGFDCYIIIYKWSKDRLLSIRSKYVEQRERSLENRQSDLRGKENLSAAEQTELDKIYKQLKEIESFKLKIDELLAEGYNPILDDGVGKNIAPLQKKKMIAYDVLNAGQLKKYLNADW
ncbi:BREX-1 system adenine-specific DNA-methyltransferase PglX [Saccharicrinis aurantiacus]|uniref:BREX-1 system adenine-specific DNA-methyltransferase PglX n=1 Tax=Saccharicrinis aurantiacus TaxID=1849719 RepID=UPI0009500A4F|nr:BREX-1 system adenine-specific DNA-methyltransferase PglX [Saccharicrinis aurantiacus]